MNYIKQLAEIAGEKGCEALFGERMDKYTTFKIGGPADLIVAVENEEALSALVSFISRNQVPCHILGKGSNLLVSDEGIRGAVLKLSGDFQRVEVLENNRIRAGAAAPLSAVCKAALDSGLTGMEFAWGIPGSVGGAAFMDAGAYGSEMKDVLVSCRYMDMDGSVHEMPSEEMDLGYRHSVFQQKPAVILDVLVQLNPGNTDDIREQMDTILNRRKSKQPLEYPSAGSVFKRPEGHYAGALIQECGLKGKQIGGAQVSEKHAGFIINVGGATCRDVMDLVALIQKTVLAETGVTLECEIRPVQ